MTPALKARIMANLHNNRSKINDIQANATKVIVPSIEVTSITPIEAVSITPIEAASVAPIEAVSVAPIEAASVTPIEAAFVASIETELVTPVEITQTGHPSLTDDPSGNRHPPPSSEIFEDDDMLDNLSYTSTLPDVFDVDMDDSALPATGPWTVIDHFTGEMIVDEEDPSVTPTVPGSPANTTIQAEVVLGVAVLIETGRPSLLFVDQDERPDWLIWSANEFLQHVPYYMRLNRVVDLFFAQEARLGYPAKVSAIRCLSRLRSLITFFTNHQSVRLALPSGNRPTEVAVFMKNARDFSRGDNVDAEKFGAQVIKWWLTIQPTTRKAWPPSYQSLPEGFSFEYFNRGGPNGTFLMILCLSWWANALVPDADHTNFKAVVHDVCWVLEQIASHA